MVGMVGDVLTMPPPWLRRMWALRWAVRKGTASPGRITTGTGANAGAQR